MIKTLQVNFLSENIRISGTIYLPELYTIDSKMPGIILCQGFAATKEMLLPVYAEKFAQNGYIVLAFDYRGFGDSGGEPGRLVPKLQIEDIKNATSFLASFDGIDADRIGLWGSSYGGANAIIAASMDGRVKCLCVQLAFGDGERCVTLNMTAEEINKFKETLVKLRNKKEQTGKEMMISLDKMLSDEQSKAFLQENIDRFPELKIKIPFLTVFETMNHKPEEYLKNLHIPVLFIGAENDLVNPISETISLFEKALEPKSLVVIKDAKHFDLYSGKHLEQSIFKQLSWFGKYV